MSEYLPVLDTYRESATKIVVTFEDVANEKRARRNQSSIEPLDERFILVEALFLRLVTNAESVTDNLFWSLMIGDVELGSNFKVRQVASDIETAKLLYNSGEYMSWLPIKEVPDRTNRFFIGSNPFSRCDPAWRDALSQVHKVRNFIAHRSESSIAKLEFIQEAFRPVNESDTVARFLLSSHSGEYSKFHLYADALDQWLRSCCLR